jgi:hypothetical protein
VAQIPDTIVLKRDRDLVGRQNEIWVRRGLFALMCVVPVLALLNLFGQRPSESTAAVKKARLPRLGCRMGAQPLLRLARRRIRQR